MILAFHSTLLFLKRLYSGYHNRYVPESKRRHHTSKLMYNAADPLSRMRRDGRLSLSRMMTGSRRAFPAIHHAAIMAIGY
jgi:hypothetical protein